jgi:tRNA(Ile2)-agmatinylcytidine synthase
LKGQKPRETGEIVLVAFDDTDSPTGGCTTHMVFRVLLAVPELALRGMPRLVRLNPNVPWKTRGNGAVVLDLVKPTGPQVRVGELQGREILAFPDGAAAERSAAWVERIWTVLQKHSEPDAQPGLALFDSPPSELHYWSAVRETLHEAPNLDFSYGKRALIGCQAAAAWQGPASSYEFIAYRAETHVGTKRKVIEAPLMNLDSHGLFHTYDAEEKVLCCVPNTPCPVLLGLRGSNPDVLQQRAGETLPLAVEEPIDGWLLFATNQASGDHVTKVPTLLEADVGMTLQLSATVAGTPEWGDGGHLRVEMDDEFGIAFTAIAFEPTKGFRHELALCQIGDKLELVGAWDKTLRLESFTLLEAKRPGAIPQCCGKSMKSQGAGAGYKCSCGSKAVRTTVPGPTGSFEVPVIARRHLHKPLAWN